MIRPLPSHEAPPVLGQRLSVELMSTVWADRHGVHDSLATDGGAAAWVRGLGDRAPSADSPTDGERSALIRLRDAARRVAAHVTDDSRQMVGPLSVDVESAVATINSVASTSVDTPELVVGADGSIERARTRAALLSSVAVDVIDLFGSPERDGLRACLAPRCVLYFLKDHPRREWCSPECGNRARVARHYDRRRRR